MLHLFSLKVGNEMEEEKGEGERQKESKHAQARGKFVVSEQQQLERRHPWDGFPLL